MINQAILQMYIQNNTTIKTSGRIHEAGQDNEATPPTY